MRVGGGTLVRGPRDGGELGVRDAAGSCWLAKSVETLPARIHGPVEVLEIRSSGAMNPVATIRRTSLAENGPSTVSPRRMKYAFGMKAEL